MRWGVVVLAAGHGTRMRSSTPKVLHKIAGRTLIDHVLDQALETAKAADIRVVVGHGADAVRAQIAPRAVKTALQDPQLGTGHALDVGIKVGIEANQGDLPDAILVLSGDVPLLRGSTLQALRNPLDEGAAAVMLTADLMNPGSYGRVLRDGQGRVQEIVEAKDADQATLACTEVNAGIYAFRSASLITALAQLQPNNAQQEYYLTDVIALLKDQALDVEAVMLSDSKEMTGVNTRADLSEAGKLMNRRIINDLMDSGVTIVDPQTTWIDVDCIIAPEVIIEPGVVLKNACRIGANAHIGANSVCSGIEIGANEIVPPLSLLTRDSH